MHVNICKFFLFEHCIFAHCRDIISVVYVIEFRYALYITLQMQFVANVHSLYRKIALYFENKDLYQLSVDLFHGDVECSILIRQEV